MEKNSYSNNANTLQKHNTVNNNKIENINLNSNNKLTEEKVNNCNLDTNLKRYNKSISLDLNQNNSFFQNGIAFNPYTIINDFQHFRLMHRPFGKSKRKLIFILIFLINCVINFDHGAIPAATGVLKNNFNLNNFQLGIVGSLVYLGLVLGALSASFLFQNYSSKWIVVISLIFTSIFLYFFTISESVFFMGINRVGTGFFQIFCVIYFPVWVIEYGILELRTYWLSFLQLGVPLGTVIGYLIEAVLININNIDSNSYKDIDDSSILMSNYNNTYSISFNNKSSNTYVSNFELIENKYENINIIKEFAWKKAFYIQILLLLVLVVLLILTPDKFFSKNYKRSNINKSVFQSEYKEKKIKEINQIPKNMIKYKNFKTLRRDEELNKYSRLSDYSIFSVIDQNDEETELSLVEILFELFSNSLYFYCLLSMCTLYFIITGIQFWISDYMIFVLNANQQQVFISFSIVCVTAPVLGIAYGGYAIQMVGGFTSIHAIDKCLIFAIIAAVFGVLSTFIFSFFPFVVLIWLLLFFGAAIMPGLTGIMLNSLGDYSKEIANSVTHLCNNLLGYLPSPLLYGLVCSYTGGVHSTWGLKFLMLFSIIGVIMMYIAKTERHKFEFNSNANNPLIDNNNKSISKLDCSLKEGFSCKLSNNNSDK